MRALRRHYFLTNGHVIDCLLRKADCGLIACFFCHPLSIIGHLPSDISSGMRDGRYGISKVYLALLLIKCLSENPICHSEERSDEESVIY